MREEMARLEPFLIKKSLLRSIQEQERLRSQYVVERYRASLSEHVPNIDLASRPLQKKFVVCFDVGEQSFFPGRAGKVGS